MVPLSHLLYTSTEASLRGLLLLLRDTFCFILCLTLFCALSSITSFAENTTTKDYARLRRDNDNLPVALETSIVSYTNGKVRIDLCAAVHVADRDYYKTLNGEFKKYDKVLYELVSPEENQIPEAGNSSSVSQIQRALKDLLGFDFQLDVIDYKAPNFVHADLTHTDLLKAIHNRGETVWSLVIKGVLSGMNTDNSMNEADELFLIVSYLTKPVDERKYVIRSFLARSLEDMDKFVSTFEGPVVGAIIKDRNAKAIEVAQKEIKRGVKSMVIFYGGAHMPDLASRLSALGFRKSAVRWLTAWKLRSDA